MRFRACPLHRPRTGAPAGPASQVFVPIETQALALLTPQRSTEPPRRRLDRGPLILYSRTAWGGTQCWQAIQSRRIVPHVLCELDAPETIALMVGEGLGVLVLPVWEGLRSRHQGVRITELKGPSRQIGLLMRAQDQGSPAVKLLLETLTDDGRRR